MARDIITIPPDLCRVTAFDWDIDWRTQPGGETTAGNSQIYQQGFPRWFGNLPLVLTPSLILRWRAVRAHARGRLGLYKVTMPDWLIGVPGEGQPWYDGQPWGNDEFWESNPLWLFAANAPRGSSTIRVTVPEGMPAPQQGRIVSHNDWPTIITSVAEISAQWELTIARPLIEAAVSGDPLSLRPTGIFEAISDGTGNPAYDLDRVARPVMEFREYLNR